MTRLSATLATALGLLAAIACMLSLPSLVQLTTRQALEVQLDAPDSTEGPKVAFSAKYADERTRFLLGGVQRSPESELEAGLHYLQWQHQYGGGHQSSVGHTQLVGPFQDPAAPPCSLFLLIDPLFLDDGEASEGTIAHLAKAQIERELSGLSIWPLGDFRKATKVGLSWVRWSDGGASLSRGLKKKLGGKRSQLQGHLRVVLTLQFEDGRVPLELTMVPVLAPADHGQTELHFAHAVRARLKLDNRIYQWIANRFDGNDRVSRYVQGEVGKELIHVLSTPPPIPLSSSAELSLSFCQDRQLGFDELGFVAVPLALELDEGKFLPPLQTTRKGPMRAPMTTPLAIDMDTNALNAILHKLWSSKLLDRELAQSLLPAFNEQETVKNFLSLRLKAAHFPLPPTLHLSDSKESSFELRATAALQLQDQSLTSESRLFTQLDFGLDLLGDEQLAPDDLVMRHLEMTCLAEDTLRSCYSEILAQVRANQAPLQLTLAESFQTLMRQLLIERDIGTPGTPGYFHLEHASFRTEGAILRTELHGRVLSL